MVKKREENEMVIINNITQCETQKTVNNDRNISGMLYLCWKKSL